MPHLAVAFVFQQEPVQLLPIVPFNELSEFASHKQQFFPRMRIHKTQQHAQGRKFLFIRAVHLIQQRFFTVHHFVVGIRENEVFRKRVEH